MLLRDRVDAGRRLAAVLGHLRAPDVVVLGLPRGGVPVAAEVARALGAPLDVIVVRKLGVPYRPELAMGAIGEEGVRVLHEEVLASTRVTADELAEVERRERAELDRRARLFRAGCPRLDLTGRTAVVVDDGLATGSTARAACQVARAYGAARVVLAVPVAPVGWQARMGAAADDYVALDTPAEFWAIGQFYRDFTQTTDEDVVACLDRQRGGPVDREVEVRAGPIVLEGHLTVPGGARGVVAFAHGSGSSRRSPRNRYVAQVLHGGGLGTLLLDLLTGEEEERRANVFDIGLLAGRLVGATRWLRDRPEVCGMAIGFFGASTGAAAALWASTERGTDVRAVVSRGGRPDLAWPRLPAVTAPTLLVVGGRDDVVLDLNRQAQAQLRCRSELVVVPGATHLFEEPGTLDQAANAARDWFTRYLGAAA
ncbi:MAG TPA: phosphoribosyltransferase family protein [Actinotalea sp.]|nr:phosphoribosyltransferase family protein [Actinotalea sp.]